jgi:hypothetical protein
MGAAGGSLQAKTLDERTFSGLLHIKTYPGLDRFAKKTRNVKTIIVATNSK